MRIAALGVLLLSLASPAIAQTDSRLTLDGFPDKIFLHTRDVPQANVWGLTFDRPIYEAQSHVQGGAARPGDTAQLFHWDSIGRFRFVPSSDASPTIGYRYLTINLDTDARQLPDTLDDVSLAGGLRLGDVGGGQFGVAFGAGYAGDNLFADTDGIYGIGHVTWRRPIDERSALVLSLDYQGNRGLLPDVPLPGFAYERRANERLTYAVGFPRSGVQWEVAPQVTLSAAYEVPFTADVGVNWQFAEKLSLIANYASSLNPFFQDERPRTDRIFYQMQRVEIGLRYVEPNFVFEGLSLDVAVVGGYAFEQQFARGWDVRALSPTVGLEDVPYAGIVLRGQF